MTRAWYLPTLFVVCGAFATAPLLAEGRFFAAALLTLVFVLFAWLQSPLVFPRSISAAEAQRRSEADGRPIVYWRTGCTYCLRLRLRLGRSGHRLHWVDIGRDPAAAAVVRAANDGDEIVPTVMVAGRPYTNPDPAWVRARLSPTT
ncbi:glutaredoxin domain-containing protein [Streptomyces sp. NPDC046831]|uniref:glutaredoxin domain-containing protein n=1 Tax=Streptomyces sp. NPDC046831 TaxID=3154805 RepID=UPI0033E123F8